MRNQGAASRPPAAEGFAGIGILGDWTCARRVTLGGKGQKASQKAKTKRQNHKAAVALTRPC